MSYLSKWKGGYEDIWKAIIRPPKEEYNIKDLGPSEFLINGKVIKRTDIQIKNKRGFNLECSHFEPVKRLSAELPCVIYLHGNCSSRLECLPCLDVLLPSNITLFTFDFSACGLSEGEFISLGWYERDDVDVIVSYLRGTNKVSTIGLWGRSMGAATALLHADRDPSIAGIVCDSSFTSLKVLAEDLCKTYTKVPKFILSGALSIVRKTIQSKAKFDINHLSPIDHVKQAFIPALFCTGKEDIFIKPEHTKKLHEDYAGDKNIIIVDGDHNSARPSFFLDSVGIFFYNTLQCQMLFQGKELDHHHGSIPKSERLGRELQKAAYESISNKGIGNENQVQEYLEDFDDADLKAAIEESLKLQKEADEEKDGQKPKESDNKKEVVVNKKNIKEVDLLEGFGDDDVKEKKGGEKKQDQKESHYPDLLKFDDDDEEEKSAF